MSVSISDWEYVWVCKCGIRLRTVQSPFALFETSPACSSRFLTFGHDQICQRCGEVLGENGAEDQVECVQMRFREVRDVQPIWWRPSTWGKTHQEYQTKGGKWERM